jgi:high affinity Mn2+ porin
MQLTLPSNRCFGFVDLRRGALAGTPMNLIRRLAHSGSLHPHRILFGALHVIMVIALMENAAADDNLVTGALATPSANSAHYWNGFYAGARVGYAWGSSNWKESSSGAPNASGSLNLFQPLNVFNDTGSFSQGLQAGYNYVLPSTS